MSLGELEEPWGQLVSTELPPGAEEERVPVLGSTFLIGRAKGQMRCTQLSYPLAYSLAHSLSLFLSLTHSPIQKQIW